MSLTLTRRHNVDRFGYLIPTRYGNVPMVGAVATYRPGEGRFGGAVAVEEGTTNLVYDSGTIFRGTHISPDELPAPSPVTPVFCYTWTNLNWNGDIELAKTFQAGDVVTISGWIYESGPWAILEVFGAENGTTRNFGRVFNPTGQIGWHYFEKTVVFQGETRNFRIEDGGWDYYNPDRADESQIWLVNVQIEEKPFATSFVAGTRAAGRLMYPGAIPSNEGTLLIWAKKNTLELNTRDGYRKILDAQLPRIDFQWHQAGNLSANFGGANLRIPDPAQDLDWHQYAITYSGRTVKMYFDGQLVASGQAQEDLVNFSELCVGARWDGSGAGNALYDELLILPYAASEEEIRAWYEADGPIPPHPAALLQWDWQAVRPATMVAL